MIFAGNFLSTIILAVSSIVIARLLGPASYGSYSLVTIIPTIFQLFIGLGVASAITRNSAYYIARGEVEVAKRFSVNAILFLILFGVVLSLLCYASAGLLSSEILHRKELTSLVQDISLVVLAQTLYQSAISALVGWNSMGLASIASILQAAIRLSIAPVLVFSGFGVFGAVTGYTSGYLFAGLMAALVFYAYKLRGANGGGLDGFLHDVREMVSYGLPIYGGGILTGLSTSYITVLVAAIAVNSVVGDYQAALNITTVISLSASAITAALFPAFSSLHGMGADTAGAFRHATKYVAYLLVPVIFLLVGVSDVVMRILYGSAFSSAAVYLDLLALSNVPSAAALSVVMVFFNGIGKTRLSLVVSGVLAGLNFLLAPLLAISAGLGVEGLIYGTIISATVSTVVASYFASRYLRATANPWSIGAIIGASILGYLAIASLSFVPLPRPAALLMDIVVFLVVYLTSAPLLRAVDAADIERLGLAIAGMGAFSRILRPLLRYELFIMGLLKLGGPRRGQEGAAISDKPSA